MKIEDFNIVKGLYSFEFNELTTESHSHPVVEIISTTNGTFSLESNGRVRKNLTFSIVESNVDHKIDSKNCTTKVLMIESHNSKLITFLNKKGIELRNGIYFSSSITNQIAFFSEVKSLAKTFDLKTPSDSRIAQSVRIIEENKLLYKELISELTTKVFLSESRLSHLFKEHIGISIKKYFVWNRLKQAVHLYLTGKNNLTELAIQSGFFDQSHFINSFKDILGVSPGKTYNSRILQL